MIDSIYTVIDAYKRQGRINAQAALSVLNIPSESVAKRTMVTPIIEFKIDALATVNSYTGWLFEARLKPVTEDDISLVTQLSILKTSDYWDSRGRKMIYDEYSIAVLLREYIGLCFNSHYSASDVYSKFSKYAQKILNTEKIDLYVSCDMLNMVNVYMLPNCINGISEENVRYFLCSFETKTCSLEEYVSFPVHFFHFDPIIASRSNKLASSISLVDDLSGKYVCSGTVNDLLLNFPNRPFRRWCDDIFDLTLCCEDLVYSIQYNGVVYFFGKYGRPLPLERITVRDLWSTYSNYREVTGMRTPLRYGNGLTVEGLTNPDIYGKYCAIQDITPFVYDKIEWTGEYSERWDPCLFSALRKREIFKEVYENV